MTAEQVVASDVLSANPCAFTVDLDGEAVVLDESVDRLHLLNRTAALVWHCLDGESSIEEICRDLAEGLGVAFDQVLADTLEVVQNLVEEGLAASSAFPSGMDAIADETGPIVEPPNP